LVRVSIPTIYLYLSQLLDDALDELQSGTEAPARRAVDKK